MTDAHLGVIIEEMRDQNDKILEGIGAMLPLVRRIPAMEADISELKIDMKAVKSALRYTNKDVQNHERRITALEART